MDKLRLFQGGFPGTTKTWDFLQNAYTAAIGALTQLGGDTYILKGVERTGQNGVNITEGSIVYQGEYLPFKGGIFGQEVSIYEEVEEALYNQDDDNDGNLDAKPAYITRYAQCGTGGIASFDFGILKGFTPLSQLSMPIGAIMMWNRPQIPIGWKLCDGTNGTPNLMNLFVVGAGDNYNIGDMGGTDQVTLSVDQMPKHNHTGTTNSKGKHRHSGTTNNAGEHRHSVPNETGGSGGSGLHFRIQGQDRNRQLGRPSGTHNHVVNINEAGEHNHDFTTSFNGNGKAHENRPPYYALAYIQFTGL